jgi:hypothetical protein
MELNAEKRCEERQKCHAAIEWAYFNKSDFFCARLLNFSRGGGYFESGHPLIPGATILIRLQKYDSGDEGTAECRYMKTTALGEVKWCRELFGGPAVRFGIGVRYHIPV